MAYVHCGILVVKLRDLLGLPRPYDLNYANPLDVIPAANRHPGLTFCVPHFGAGFLRETLIAGGPSAPTSSPTPRPPTAGPRPSRTSRP